MYRFLACLSLVTLQICSNLVGATPGDGGFLFGVGDLEIYDMPASCRGQTYCFEKDNNYPQKMIDKMLAQLPQSLSKRHTRAARSLNYRQGGEVPGNPDCPTNDTFVDQPIYYIYDEFNQVRVVVQSPNFQQIHSVKWCLHPGRITEDTPHFMKGSQTLEKFKIECVNTLMDVDFFVLKDDEDVPKMELVKVKDGIPVCCRCRYTALNNQLR